MTAASILYSGGAVLGFSGSASALTASGVASAALKGAVMTSVFSLTSNILTSPDTSEAFTRTFGKEGLKGIASGALGGAIANIAPHAFSQLGMLGTSSTLAARGARVG